MKTSLRVIMGCFLAFIFAFFAMNVGMVSDGLVYAYEQGNLQSFAQWRDEIQARLKSYDFSLRDQFVNLNGLFEHATGRRLINKITVLNNGNLLAAPDWCDPQALARDVAGFGREVERLGAAFAYVQEPFPLDLSETLLPEGVDNDGHAYADAVTAALEGEGVDVLDLREALCRTPEDIETYFYRTDHHWNTYGAFVGYRLMADKLQAMLGDETDISDYTNPERWQPSVYEQVFLGSNGKRVGRYVAGMDDVVLLTPRFDTRMRCEIPQLDAVYEGDFADAVIRMEKFGTPGDDFNNDPYSVYVGDNYKLVRHVNERAPIARRVLLIKDSYMLPVQAFLSTVFAQVEAIDYRYFDASTLLEYVRQAQLDAVIVSIHPSTFDDAQQVRWR